MNHFSTAEMAKRYAEGRPFYHSVISLHIQNQLQLRAKFKRALDIACGTGLSTAILCDLAEEVFGTDLSEEMLAFAKKRIDAHFSLAPAEKQPFPDKHFDLITVASGVHWFDIDHFLAEAKRLLKSQRYLVLYDNFFLGKMYDDVTFSNWFREKYLKSFPSPPRNRNYDWSEKNLMKNGLRLMKEDDPEISRLFSLEELCSHLGTFSNIDAAVSSGKFSYKEVDDWLNKEIRQFYMTDDENKSFHYRANIKYIKKIF